MPSDKLPETEAEAKQNEQTNCTELRVLPVGYEGLE